MRLKPASHSRQLSITSPAQNTLYFSSNEGQGISFKFDTVLPASSSQQEVFLEVKHIVLAALSGFNGTILSYGQASGDTGTVSRSTT